MCPLCFDFCKRQLTSTFSTFLIMINTSVSNSALVIYQPLTICFHYIEKVVPIKMKINVERIEVKQAIV